MIYFRLQGKEKNHLIRIEHGQPIDILEEMEQEIIHDDKKTFHIGDDEEG